LRFHLPGASHVQLAGDFNGWNPTSHPLTRQDGGWWEIDLDLEPGIYQYKLVVDGEWVLPEDVERRVDDGFGGQNAVLVIPGESW
jgi:1,4-alpha-glucan branching enzyme